MARRRPWRDTAWLRLAATSTLLLLTPFVIFLRHHGYALLSSESLILVAAIVAIGTSLSVAASRWATLAAMLVAALVVLLVDFQFDFDVPVPGVGKTTGLLASVVLLTIGFKAVGERAVDVLLLMAFTGLASTFLVPSGRLQEREGEDRPGNPGLPVLVHLILDEHIGVEGLRTDGTGRIADDLRDFLAAHRFAVFGGAYTEFAETVESIAHLLDLAPAQHRGDLLAPAAGFAARLTQSRYFETLSSSGYEIDVWQPDHLDLCHSTTAVRSCVTYASTRLGVLQREEDLTTLQRARVIVGAYLSRSDFWNEGKEAYNTLRGRVPGGSRWPPWSWERTRVSPVATLDILDEITARLRRARRGDAFVAHLLLPHYPYVYDDACDTRPPGDWLDRNDPMLTGANNTPEGRALRYARYGEQLLCTQGRLAMMFEAIPLELRADTVWVIHGDHGSRISLIGRRDEDPRRMIRTDYMDSYSTVFAVRSPGLGPTYDGSQLSAACLLQQLVAGKFRSLAIANCNTPPTIQWKNSAGRYVAQTLPTFTDPSRVLGKARTKEEVEP